MTSFPKAVICFVRRTRAVKAPLALGLALLLVFSVAFPQKIHEDYTKKIREYTTDPHFSTKYVNYLPYKEGIPSPLEVLGHIVGAPNILSYSSDVYKYFRALAAASPRVKVFTIGKTEEGRDWILVVVADEGTIKNLSQFKQIIAKLSDPRKISDAEAQTLIKQGKPIYWATGGMHSSETGSVEMLMELAYRLAVDDSPFIKTIRENSIVLITPILEVDGRDKYVDLAMAPRKDPKANVPRNALWWGKYVAHDNNRDGIVLALALSRNIMKVELDYHPQVMHDLHESASHLYISTGSGPYNAWLDPIVVDEWHQLAYQEVDGMTREGVPGVWTHAFYDGWAPNYAFYAANGHNAIGRFYETQGAGDGSTRVITNSTDRAWYRPNPPVASTVWSIRNNVNMQQSALLMGMNYIAVNREKYLENFYLKSKRSVAKPRNEGPAAYVFPGNDPRLGQQARLLRLLQGQGVEVHKADKAFKVGDVEYPAASYVIRMDQPFCRMADMLLDKQYFNVKDPSPYDDVGWTLGPLFNVKTVRVDDVSVLSAPMTQVKGEVRSPGGVTHLGAGAAQVFLINHNADNAIASFRFKYKDLKILAAEKSFESNGKSFNAGTFIIKIVDNGGNIESLLDESGKKYGLSIFAVPAVPAVAVHEVAVPRIAVMHTWQNTQTEGWVRIALDELEIPYEYISVHSVRDNARLRDKYDVILFGPSSGDALSVVTGVTGAQPIPWKKTPLTPNIGSEDSTDDMRGGIELEGVLHLRDFIRDGGLFITLGNSSALPIQFGLAGGISIRQTQNLWARGSIYKADVFDKTSPIVYGYDDSLGVYFSQAPVFGAGGGFGGGRGGMMLESGPAGRPSGRGSANDPDIPQGRPRDIGKASVEEFRKTQPQGAQAEGRPGPPAAASRARTILRFTGNAAELLISGGLDGGQELAGAPALVDAPLGAGHVIMFSFNPMWRHETHGSFFLVFNAMLNFKNLNPAPVPAPAPAPEKK
ncbi:MAG: M14 family zinc carboxypeptidase [Candidatus Aminicenantales bacterium]